MIVNKYFIIYITQETIDWFNLINYLFCFSSNFTVKYQQVIQQVKIAQCKLNLLTVILQVIDDG